MRRPKLVILTLVFACIATFSQNLALAATPDSADKAPWFLLSPSEGSEGTSTALALREFPESASATSVLVAVIDSGVDIDHPLLRNRIWTGPHDLHGWNFAGNANGTNLTESNLEVARIYGKLSELPPAEAAQVKADYDAQYAEIQSAIQSVPSNQPALAKQLEGILQLALNPNFDPSAIIGDHAYIMNEQGYGNADVLGGDGVHGTHVAGIIAQQAASAVILPLRILVQGDERDKDVGNAIRFAVDHGARVINMSFGKRYSPQHEWVEQSVRYAIAHDVLLVHSAGNDGLDVDENFYYPHRPTEPSQWIEVGASGAEKDASLAGAFSNYGKYSVDLFAPGEMITSSLPHGRTGPMSGTSMAAAQVSGVAALLLSRFPSLHAAQVKEILVRSSRHYEGLLVERPRKQSGREVHEQIAWENLSISGGIVDAEAALKMATNTAYAGALPQSRPRSSF